MFYVHDILQPFAIFKCEFYFTQILGKEKDDYRWHDLNLGPDGYIHEALVSMAVCKQQIYVVIILDQLC